MYVVLEKLTWLDVLHHSKSYRIVNRLVFTLKSNDPQESSILNLNKALKLLDTKGLNSYAIRLTPNTYGTLDATLDVQLTRVERIQTKRFLQVDVIAKLERVLAYFKEGTELPRGRFKHYNAFLLFLEKLPSFSSYNDAGLISMEQQWTGLRKLVKLNGTFDKYLDDSLKSTLTKKAEQSDNLARMPAISESVQNCAFDNPTILKQQHIMESENFWVLTNNRPYGNSKAHLLVVSKTHVLGLSEAPQKILLELQAILYATILIIREKFRCQFKDIALFIQKHAAGMTVPHFHAHILLKPNLNLWIENSKNELKALLRMPGGRLQPLLRPEKMRPIQLEFAKPITVAFHAELRRTWPLHNSLIKRTRHVCEFKDDYLKTRKISSCASISLEQA